MMLDLAGDYELMDGVVEVTLQVRNSSNAIQSEVEAVKALPRAVDAKALRDFSSLALSSTDRVFHLFVATLDGVVPQNRYTIEMADGTIWSILAASFESMGSRYRCPARLWKT